MSKFDNTSKMPTGDTPNAAELCVSCGLCCNGVLYTNAKAEADEVSRLEASGLVVEKVGDRVQFQLPCHHNDQGRCSIYANRFTKCRTFRCALLKRLDAGEVALPEALEDVARAKAMVASVAALNPDWVLVAARRAKGVPRPEGDPAAARLWIESVALDLYLDRTFRNKPSILT